MRATIEAKRQRNAGQAEDRQASARTIVSPPVRFSRASLPHLRLFKD